MKDMKKIIGIVLLSIVMLFYLNGCGATKHVVVNNNTEVQTRDSIIFRDSTRLVDSIIYVEIPREKVMEIISQIDTSYLETSIAESYAYVDTTSLMIVHSLANKDTVLQEKIVYKDRYITTEKIVYRDSIETKEIPVEVQIEKKVYPKTYWWLLGFFVIVVGIFVVKIYLKFKTGK
jgi:hypothetical protein